MNKKESNSLEIALFSMLFLVALGVRFLFLGSQSLLETEAVLAFRSWELALGKILAPGESTLYESLTALLFSIFGSSNLLARFLPAAAGSMIIWLPYLLRDRLGQPAALVTALGLALDPGLVIASRQIGSPMLTMVLILFAVGFMQRDQTFAGFLLALLALFTGKNFWLGALGLLLAAGISNWAGLFSIRMLVDKQISGFSNLERSQRVVFLLLPLLLAGAAATYFFQIPAGLSSWMEGVPMFLGGWLSPTVVPGAQLLILLLVNAPLALGYGLLHGIYSWRAGDEFGKVLSLWFVLSILVILIYPGRTALDLVWALIPLWIMAGRQISVWILKMSDLWVNWVFGVFIFIIAVLNWLSVSGLLYRQITSQTIWLQIGLSGASLLLIILTMIIIASEWSWEVSKTGAHLGLSAVLLVYVLAALNLGAYTFAGDPRSLWVSTIGAGEFSLLKDTLDEISLGETGRRDSIRGAVFGGGSALRWELRGYHNLEFYSSYQDGVIPPVIITDRENASAELEDLYWGQNFPQDVQKAWQGLIPDRFVSWLAFRDGPVERDQVILWVREDALPWVISESAR